MAASRAACFASLTCAEVYSSNQIKGPIQSTNAISINHKLEECIDDERQFKRAKLSQAPGDAIVLKRFFRDNFVIFRRRSKRMGFLESVNFSTCVCMQLFNFRDGHMITFRHPSGVYTYQMPGHRLS